MPKTPALDLDVVIDELEALLRYRGPVGLVDAVATAPRLLALEPYRSAADAADARSMLARDIEAAIARLPAAIQGHARGILPIDAPNEYMIGRQRNLGIDNYSGDAVRWYRRAVLGRVAFELASSYDSPAESRPSYCIESVEIVVTPEVERRFALISRYHQTIELTCLLTVLVSDLRLFQLTIPVTKPEPSALVEQIRLQSVSDDDGYTDTILLPQRVPFTSDQYILPLSRIPPPNMPIKLTTTIKHKIPPYSEHTLTYSPREPVGRLSMGIAIDGNEPLACKCEARHTRKGRPSDQYRVLRNYKSKVTREDFPVYGSQVTTSFLIRSPRVGRDYALNWNEKSLRDG